MILGFAIKLSIVLIYFIVTESSWNFPSMDFMQVLRVETDLSDRSSDMVVGFVECVIKWGIEEEYLLGDGVAPGVHFLAV